MGHNIGVNLKYIEYEGVDWIHLAQDRDRWLIIENTAVFHKKKGAEFLHQLNDY
jgi:hypothetical protein